MGIFELFFATIFTELVILIFVALMLLTVTLIGMLLLSAVFDNICCGKPRQGIK